MMITRFLQPLHSFSLSLDQLQPVHVQLILSQYLNQLLPLAKHIMLLAHKVLKLSHHLQFHLLFAQLQIFIILCLYPQVIVEASYHLIP